MAVLKDVKVLFSNVSNQDDFSQKYQVVVSLTEAQAVDAEAAGIKIKTKEYEGKTQYQATFKTKFRPDIVQIDGKTALDLGGSEIGRMSLVSIQYKFRDWISPSKETGTSADLLKVQVKVQEGSSESEFEDETDSLGSDEFNDDEF
tara:strand:+ start:162 stop:599 length:438 start_codon:yes stop_codon:yes gene_type:complete